MPYPIGWINPRKGVIGPRKIVFCPCGRYFKVNPASNKKYCNQLCWNVVHSSVRTGMKFSDEHRLNIALARTGTTASEETEAKISKERQHRAKDPIWCQRMSEQTRNGWKKSEVRAAMLEGQRAHFDTTKNGNNYPVGTPQSELDFLPLLSSAGYITGYVIPTHRPENNGGGYYKLDYAHLEAKVNIEIDGSSHRFKEEKDAKRDAFLRNLGWKVIRIKV